MSTSAHTPHRVRFFVLWGVVVCVACVLIARLYVLQVVHGAEYRAIATEQYAHHTAHIFDRGSIFFTRKDGSRVAAASIQRGYVLTVDPRRIETLTEASSMYDALSPYMALSRETFMQRATKKDDPYEELAQHLTADEAEAVQALRLPGVQVFPQHWRSYTAGSLGAHVLGFMGYSADGNEKTARYGIERYWDAVLMRSRERAGLFGFAETFSDGKTDEDNRATTHNRTGDVVTTIEPTVQAELEQTLAGMREAWGSVRAGGVVVDPYTGAIYALALHPTYNPNTYAATEDVHVFRNGIVEDVHEMGSIMKPLAMAIALEDGAVRATTEYEDSGSIEIDGYTIRNYDGEARGVVDMQDVLNQSLNVGMAFVTEQTGGERMAARLLELGIGEETGIDLPFEARGLTDNFANKRDVEYVTASFGQGIALTPIATVRALASLGNGGLLVTPHLVREVRYEHGGTGNVAPDDTVRVFQEETTEEITRMLVEVVDSSLRGGTVAHGRYSIAAKTGTAQIARTDERGYYDDKFLHSFFGYFPAYEPRFLVFLYHIEPQHARYASETLTEPFMHMADFLIHYYEIPPDR